MIVRQLLLAAALLLPWSASHADPAAVTRRLSIAEPVGFLTQPPETVQRRFALYRQLGIGTLRQSWGWRRLERSAGRWQLPEAIGYLRAAEAAGFRFKMTLDAIGAPPQWFLEAHPDVQIRDSQGHFDHSDLSLWYPGLRALLSDKMDHMVQLLVSSGTLDHVDFLVVGLGPASEPRYPVPWPPGAAHTPQNRTFWFHDANARADFAARMQAKYHGIEAANGAWRTRFADWSAVQLPAAHTRSGMWRDVLDWYRDSKRDFIEWEIGDVEQKLARYAGGHTRPQLVIFVPGGHRHPEVIEKLIATGEPEGSLIEGTDTEFLIDTAQRHHLWLQQTGAGSQDEIRYIRDYMAAHGYSIPIWGENAGGKSALDPAHLAKVVQEEGLYGLEYISADKILAGDGVTPTDVFPAFKDAVSQLKVHFGH